MGFIRGKANVALVNDILAVETANTLSGHLNLPTIFQFLLGQYGCTRLSVR